MSATTEHEQLSHDDAADDLEPRDLAVPADEAEDVVGGTGGCPAWACGTNHNEALAVTR